MRVRTQHAGSPAEPIPEERGDRIRDQNCPVAKRSSKQPNSTDFIASGRSLTPLGYVTNEDSRSPRSLPDRVQIWILEAFRHQLRLHIPLLIRNFPWENPNDNLPPFWSAPRPFLTKILRTCSAHLTCVPSPRKLDPYALFLLWKAIAVRKMISFSSVTSSAVKVDTFQGSGLRDSPLVAHA